MFQLNKQQTLHTNGKYEKSIYELQCMKDKGEKCYEFNLWIMGSNLSYLTTKTLESIYDTSHLDLCSLGKLIFKLGQYIWFLCSVFVAFEFGVEICWHGPKIWTY